ncbi:MAG: MlaD family protein [Thermodesulfobacteriota bacterium]
MKKKTSEIWVGIFVVVGIALLALLTMKVEKFQIGKERGYRVNVFFDSAAGLDRSAEVRVAGVNVGNVEKVALEKGKAKVTFRVPPQIVLYKDSKAYLKSEGFLGEKYVEISPGTPTLPRVEPDGEIEQGEPPTDIEQMLNRMGAIREDIKEIAKPISDILKSVDPKKVEGLVNNLNQFSSELTGMSKGAKETIEKAKDVFSRVEEIGEKVKRGEGTLGKLITDETVYQEAKKTVETAREAAASAKEAVDTLKNLSEKIEKGEGTLGKLVNDDSLYRDAKDAIDSVKGIAEKVGKGEGTLGKLIHDESLYQGAKDTIQSMKGIADKVEKGEGTLGKLIYDESLYQTAKETIQSMKGIAEKVEKGEGTLGKLVSDDQLMKEAEKTMKKIQKASESIEEQTPITVLGTIIGIFF